MRVTEQPALHAQRGFSLSGLIFTLAILGVVGIFAAKIFPTFVEFRAFKNAIAAAKAQGGTVHEMQTAFDKTADINGATTITGKDLTITKEGEGTEISFSYEKRIPIVANATLLIEYSGTTAKDGVPRVKEAAPQ